MTPIKSERSRRRMLGSLPPPAMLETMMQPDTPDRYYYANEHRRGTCYDDPDRWVEHASRHDGSWWLRRRAA